MSTTTVPSVQVTYTVGDANNEGNCRVKASLRLDPDCLSGRDLDLEELELAWKLNLHNSTTAEITGDWLKSETQAGLESAWEASIKGSTAAWIKNKLPSLTASEPVCVRVSESEFESLGRESGDAEGRLSRDADGKSLSCSTEWVVQVPLYVRNFMCTDATSQTGDSRNYEVNMSQENLLHTYELSADLPSENEEAREERLAEFRDSIANDTSSKLNRWKRRSRHWKAHAKAEIKEHSLGITMTGVSGVAGSVIAGGIVVMTVGCEVM
jgi:hypothetical protein